MQIILFPLFFIILFFLWIKSAKQILTEGNPQNQRKKDAKTYKSPQANHGRRQ